jgi:hypothetical protein
MADPGSPQGFARINTSASVAASRHSGASRPPTPNALKKTHSAGFYLDDHASYDGTRYDDHGEDECTDGTDSTKESDEQDVDLEKEETEEIMPEVRDGIEDQRDLEAGPRLTKTKSSKTADPNLVTWDGPDDYANPKNWSTKRKWAATLVGEHAFNVYCKLLG